MSRAAAELIAARLHKTPELLLCASAGGTPSGTYRDLARICRSQPEIFAKLRVLQIDEWGGLPAGSPGTCTADLQEKLSGPLNIKKGRFCGFRSDAADPEKECQRLRRYLAAHGPIDLCILGLGLNGHIAMNEPADSLEATVHAAALTESSQQHAMLKALSTKPPYGLTLGMRDVLASHEILLLVSGAAKRDILTRLMLSKLTTQLPASFLLLHPNTMVMCDEEAAGGLRKQGWTNPHDYTDRHK